MEKERRETGAEAKEKKTAPPRVAGTRVGNWGEENGLEALTHV